MARTTGTESLSDLIERGVIQVDEEIVINRRSAPPIHGLVRMGGSIVVCGVLHDTPSGAAKEALEVDSVDGWLRWRVPRLGNATLASIREESVGEIDLAAGLDLESLGGKPFSTLLADPPWRFQNRTGKVAPEHRRLSRYDTMTWKNIADLPVADVMAERSHCYLWVPNALLDEGLRVMEAWGFTYKSMIVWAKRRKDGGPDGRGVGFYFRNVTESILFGVRGRLRTLDPGRRQVNMIESRKREHSRKPDEQYPIIEACSPGPYLEMFARYPQKGWTTWGNEADPSIVPRGKQHAMYRGSNGVLADSD
ncbi:MAG: MT-A70 family methyltransferase [Actinomycetota bacterium]|nr:MT-A70 family methyltransferase [Actinomycetota bacterium]MED5233311.1 MT-A70 family methyltransferase [Actinomycetota bacterium]MEE3353650.1 MT-A70 family methyltransferase [Actinomycetota bacterium]